MKRARVQTEAVYRTCLGSVLAVAYNRMPKVFHVHTNLILASGVKTQLHQRVAVVALQTLEARDGELTLVGILRGDVSAR